MTERERLIELFLQPMNVADFYDKEMIAKAYADRILADGWIRPPCKVGDMVYFANEDPRCSAEIDGIHIDENGIAFSWVQYDVGVDTKELWDEGEFNIDEIGKTVFLTFEEFEKALKERETK